VNIVDDESQFMKNGVMSKFDLELDGKPIYKVFTVKKR
jgi:hypothetical protein